MQFPESKVSSLVQQSSSVLATLKLNLQLILFEMLFSKPIKLNKTLIFIKLSLMYKLFQTKINHRRISLWNKVSSSSIFLTMTQKCNKWDEIIKKRPKKIQECQVPPVIPFSSPFQIVAIFSCQFLWLSSKLRALSVSIPGQEIMEREPSFFHQTIQKDRQSKKCLKAQETTLKTTPPS